MRFLIHIFFIITSLSLLSCKSSVEAINFSEVKEGKHLEKAEEVNLSTFMNPWLKNTEMSKFDSNLKELYNDSTYAFFGKRNNKQFWFYKIKKTIINSIDYKSIIGDSIRNKFYKEIIPNEDKKRDENQIGIDGYIDYDLKYIETGNYVQIDCEYKVKMIYKRDVKRYLKVKYDVTNNTFEILINVAAKTKL